MAIFLFSLISFFLIYGLTAAVNLKIVADTSFDSQFCPGSTAKFECQTTEGGLLWETSSTIVNQVFDDPTQPSTRMLGIFLVSLDGISQLTNGTVTAVNSTAVVNNLTLSDNGTTLKCSENADLSMFNEAVLRVAGPPPAPAVNPITVVDDNGELLISWSQSNCAVQYVVTVINSSDDRVYPNITTSNTNTTVTLPTGVEFCVTLVAVDSVGRRGPDSAPMCYGNVSATSSSVNQLPTLSPVVTNIDQIVTSSSTVSVTVTVTPVEGAVNIVVGLLVAIIIIVILFLVIVVITARICCNHWHQDYNPRGSNPKETTPFEMKLIKSLSSGGDEEDVKFNYKRYLMTYYRDPLPNDDKLFLSNPNKRGYAELAIIEKDEKTNKEMERKLDGSPSSIKDIPQSIVSLNDILKPDEDGKPVQLVLIEGTSGIGKTTLAWQLCHKWAKDELDSLKNYDLVVLVRLRKKRAQKAENFEDLLPHENKTDMKGLIAAIESGERVLIVCDGFDELPHDRQENSFYVRLFSGELLPAATVIVTTRPSASARFKKVIEQNVHRELEITGFTETGISEFAKSIFSAALFDGFQSYIQNNPPINSMMYLPLSAVIVAKIYQESYKTDTPFPNTLSELFDAFTSVLVRRHLESKDQAIEMPSSLHDISMVPRVASQLFQIVETAYNGICNNLYVFNELPKGFEHLDLMRKVTRMNMARGRYVTFVFFHHTLQEYLAALHIANKLSGELNLLKLQLEKKDMIARFLAGLCVNNCHDYSNLRQWFVQFLGHICFEKSRALQLVHIAYECPSIMHSLKVEYSEKNAFIVVLPEVGIDWYAMGYCISHFDERWGLYTTSLRKENIDLLEKGLKSSPTVPGRLKYLSMSKPDVSLSLVITSLGEFCQLECLELFYVNIDEDDEEALKHLIATKSRLKSLTHRTVNGRAQTSSFIPMLLEDSSLEELVVRTGSEVILDTELLPHANTNLKKLTISCELVQPLAALLSNMSLTDLMVGTLVYESDLPILKSLVESHSTLQVLELGKIVHYASTPKPTYTSLKSASPDLHQLVEVASNCQLKRLKLHQDDYNYLPEHYCNNNSTVC